MSLKNRIVTDVLMKLNDIISQEKLSMIEDVLVIELNKYIIQEECTELIPDNDKTTKLIQLFIANKRLIGLSESTLERYYKQNIQLLDFIRKPIDQVTTDDIRFYLALRKEQGNLCNNTVDGMRRCITSMYNFLYAEGLIEHNPATALRGIKVEKKVRKSFTDEDMKVIRKYCKSDRDKALVEFLYSTGCRVSECNHVDISDINFEEKELTVIGKGNKERVVYLTDDCVKVLKKYIRNRNDYSSALFIGKNDRLSNQGIRQALKRIEGKSGVYNIHPHRFRRTCATTLMRSNMDILKIARILGHSSISSTQIYLDLDDKDVKNSYMLCMNSGIN